MVHAGVCIESMDKSTTTLLAAAGSSSLLARGVIRVAEVPSLLVLFAVLRQEWLLWFRRIARINYLKFLQMTRGLDKRIPRVFPVPYDEIVGTPYWDCRQRPIKTFPEAYPSNLRFDEIRH